MICPVCRDVPLTREHLADTHPAVFRAAASPSHDRSYATCPCGVRLTSHFTSRCARCRGETPGVLPQLRLPRRTS